MSGDRYTQDDSTGGRTDTVRMPTGVLLDGVHIGVTWRIRLNRPYAAAMRPCVNYLDHLLSLILPCRATRTGDDVCGCRHSNLLLPVGVPLQRQRALYAVTIYCGEDLPRTDLGIMATVQKAITGKDVAFVDACVKVSFVGHVVSSRTARSFHRLRDFSLHRPFVLSPNYRKPPHEVAPTTSATQIFKPVAVTRLRFPIQVCFLGRSVPSQQLLVFVL